MRWNKTFGVFVLAAALSGCTGGSAHRLALMETLDSYRTAIRWQKASTTAAYLPAQQQQQFVALAGKLGELRVTHCELAALRIASDDQAHATMRIEWYWLRQGSVRQTTVQQRWRRVADRWALARQQRLSGTPFPLAPDFGR